MASKLWKEQTRMTMLVAKLILFAYERGWALTLGDAFRDPRVFGAPGTKMGYSHQKSTHKYRLAIDLNLFVKGEYIQKECNEYTELHTFWESIGGAPAVPGDPNHFSIAWEGVK